MKFATVINIEFLPCHWLGLTLQGSCYLWGSPGIHWCIYVVYWQWGEEYNCWSAVITFPFCWEDFQQCSIYQFQSCKVLTYFTFISCTSSLPLSRCGVVADAIPSDIVTSATTSCKTTVFYWQLEAMCNESKWWPFLIDSFALRCCNFVLSPQTMIS